MMSHAYHNVQLMRRGREVVHVGVVGRVVLVTLLLRGGRRPRQPLVVTRETPAALRHRRAPDTAATAATAVHRATQLSSKQKRELSLERLVVRQKKKNENDRPEDRLTLGGVVLAANSRLVAFPAGLYCGESLKSAGELAADPPVPPLLRKREA